MSLKDKWRGWVYPYDMAHCGNCISMHAVKMCRHPEHAHFCQITAEQKLDLLPFENSEEEFENALEKTLAIRKLFSHFYSCNPPEQSEIPDVHIADEVMA